MKLTINGSLEAHFSYALNRQAGSNFINCRSVSRSFLHCGEIKLLYIFFKEQLDEYIH